MKAFPRNGARFLLAPFLLLQLCSPVGRAQSSRPQDPHGTHGIRHVIRKVLSEDDRKFDVLKERWKLFDDPSRTMLIILGDVEAWSLRSLDDFVFQGGAVLLATEGPLRDFRLSRVTGFRVNGALVRAGPGTDKKKRVHGVDECPIVVPNENSPNFKDLFPNPRPAEADGVGLQLVTESPSYLERDRRADAFVNRMSVVATFPDGCVARTGNVGGNLNRPFAVASEAGRGRMLLIANHRIFLNQMMYLRPDDSVENALFAESAVAWLRGTDPRRDRVLVIIDGVIETNLNPPLNIVRIDVDDIQKVLNRGLNKRLMQFEDEQSSGYVRDSLNYQAITSLGDFADDTLFGFRNRRTSFFLALVLAASLVLVIYVFSRLRRASYVLDTRLPLLARAVRKSQPQAEVLAQRQKMLMDEDNLAAYARHLARDCLAATASMSPTQQPRIDASGSWWERRRLKHLVQRAWNLAYGRALPHVTKKQFHRLMDQLRSLEQALQSGKIVVSG